MIRILVFLVAVTLAAFGLSRLADTPGDLTLTWLGYEVQTSVLAALLFLIFCLFVLALLWSAIHYVLTRPAAISRFVHDRQEERGLEALSHGLIAVGAGDKGQAQKLATTARKRLPNEPLTALLRAQSAQLNGNRAEARRIFEGMAGDPKTELIGLRGLFLEANREDDLEAARQFAKRAMDRNPDLAWSVTALLELQCRGGDWAGALKTLSVARRQKHIDRDAADRQRAVLLTAQAIAAEDGDVDRARELALEANKLAPGLVPAAEMAGRLLVAQGNMSRAGRILSKAWEISPHPDLAQAYAFLRPGDSPRDRLQRVVTLTRSDDDDAVEGRVAVAAAAIEARAWEEAREALEPLTETAPPARVCTLMARIEGGELGDQGRVREWLARAVRAPRDPLWTADGYTSERWAPVSPITGALDAFEWKVPVESLGAPDADLAAHDDAGMAIFEQVSPEPLPPVAPALDEPAAPVDEPAAAAGEAAEDGVIIEIVPEELVTTEAAGNKDQDTEISAPEESKKPEEAGSAKETSENAPAVNIAPPKSKKPEIFAPPHAPDDPGPQGPYTDFDPETRAAMAEKD